MPNFSSTVNIIYGYLNIQIPINNHTNKALLALDALKALDEIELHYRWAVLDQFQMGPNFCN